MAKERISKKESNQRWREKNKEYIHKYNAAYRQTHIEQIKELKKRRQYKYPEHKNQYNRQYLLKYRRELKAKVLTFYGNGKLGCAICGEDRLDCLSIDHINGNGNQHRREIGVKAGTGFYKWLEAQGFPTGYRTLCMNCQWIEKANRKRDIGQ